MSRAWFEICVLVAATAVVSAAQESPRHAPAEISSVSVAAGDNGPVVEVLSSGPLTPQIQTVENPLRLVIDLPGSILNTRRKKIPYRNEQIKDIRLNQYQSNPAVSRIVMDLNDRVQYTWDALGNTLHIRIHSDAASTAKPPSVPALTTGVQPAAVPVSVGQSGTLVETGSRVAAGSSITAGDQTAVLRLMRGGEVHVCPGTTVSVSTSSDGKNLMLGMSKGAMETHYAMQEQVDSVLTPDFRIVLPGPGEFNLAVSTDARGNTCVASMPGSTASAVVAELLGSGTYEIHPSQQVLFRQGRLQSIELPVTPCGCPPPQEPVLRAEADPAHVIPEAKAGQKLQLENSANSGGDPSPAPLPDAGSDRKPAKPQTNVELETPLVFSGAELARARAAKTTPAAPEISAVRATVRPPAPLPAVIVIPPEPERKHKGFFGRIGGFFGSVFH